MVAERKGKLATRNAVNAHQLRRLPFGLALMTGVFALSNVLTSVGIANVVGADTQSFSPTTSGLDFLTVEPSETLAPGHFNVGLFLNHSVNSLPYLGKSSDPQSRLRYNDAILGGDLNLGVGLLPNWEIGLSLPEMIYQDVKSQDYHGQFGDNGNTEVRFSSKVHLWGTPNYGLALFGSAGINRIRNNPFIGQGAGPDIAAGLAADWRIEAVRLGLNLGYRWRNTGTGVVDSPFQPVGNEVIASAAAAYNLEKIHSALLFEVFGSRPAAGGDIASSDRSQASGEADLGFKRQINDNLAAHAGAGTELMRGLNSPDWRLYAGINYSFGPVFEKPDEPMKPAPTTQVTTDSAVATDPFQGPPKAVEKVVVHDILFEFDSDHLIVGEGDSTLKRLAEYIKRPPEVTRLVIEGYTCSIGSAQYNLDLSRRRAETIRRWLIAKYHIEPKKLEAVGFGKSKPIADNNSYQGRQLNRRVEFRIYRNMK